MSEEEKWRKRLERERAARAQAESLLEDKSSQLYEANKKLEKVNEQLEEQVVVESHKFQREEKKFKALFDSSVDGILLHDYKGKVILANQALCNLLSAEAHELVGQSVRRLLDSGEESKKLARLARSEVTEAGSSRFECELVTKDGTKKIPCEVSANRFLIDEQVLVQGIVRDITERRKVAEALEEATEAAIQGNEAKSMFLATMSHEIRTPLNGIIGFTDLMLQEELKEEHLDYLNLIKKSGGMLLNIINDILDFSKIENRQIELEEMDFNLQECIEGTLDIHAQTAASKDVELLYKIEADLPVGMRGDMGRLQQILLNLVSNALKFTEVGSVVVDVKKATDKFVEIRVKDTGIGFNELIAEKLFSPFQQADASTTRKYGGTGLGLAICKELVETMGGSIRAKSIPEKGSEFIFLLPFIPSKSEVVRLSKTIDLSWLKGMRVLVVDDHELNLKFMHARLGAWGMVVDTSFSGKEALKMIESDDCYDVILLDMLMPEMDGMELASHLMNHYGERKPPMMLVTSARLAGEKSIAKEKGFDSVVYKPVHEKELIRELSRILGEEKSEGKQVVASKRPQEKEERRYALLVEDNPINAKLGKIMVERMGISVHVAHNGKEALETLLLKSIYDVILMDMQMPVMDGLEATRQIRAGKAGAYYENTPIVAMTANATPEDEMKCAEAGMNRFVTKPIDADFLKEVFREVGVLS